MPIQVLNRRNVKKLDPRPGKLDSPLERVFAIIQNGLEDLVSKKAGKAKVYVKKGGVTYTYNVVVKKSSKLKAA